VLEVLVHGAGASEDLDVEALLLRPLRVVHATRRYFSGTRAASWREVFLVDAFCGATLPRDARALGLPSPENSQTGQ
jgi:hypothetical protein